MLPILRTCGEAEARSASLITGQPRRTSGWAATSLMRAMPCSVSPSAPVSIPAGRIGSRSTSVAGASTSFFISCRRSLPPAMYFAPAALAAAVAASRLVGWERVKTCMAQLCICCAASSIAATMFTYAPQRQMLPLIHSRISSGDPAWPSSMSAVADMIWPGVQ